MIAHRFLDTFLHSPRLPRPWLSTLAALVLFSSARLASAAGGDIRGVNLAAAAPLTYDHNVGGGAFDDGTKGDTADIVESLQGGEFRCGDRVTYLVALEVNAAPVDARQTVELQLQLSADSTGQSGSAHVGLGTVAVNYGAVAAGDGPGGTDSGIADDGGSTAVLTSAGFEDNASGAPASGPFVAGASLVAVIAVTDLEAGERVVVRVNAVLGCKPYSSPTGNLQAVLAQARVIAPVDEPVAGGAQTIPFQKVGQINGLGEPGPRLDVTVTGGGGSCPGVDELSASNGAEVRLCYRLANLGTNDLLDVALGDDAATPADSGDDVAVSLAGLADADGDGLADDLPAGATASASRSANAAGSAGSQQTFTGAATGRGGRSSYSDTDRATIRLTDAAVELSAEVVPTVAGPGQTAGYSLAVTNTGSVAIDDPELRVVLAGTDGAVNDATRLSYVPETTSSSGLDAGEPSIVSPASTRPFTGKNRQELVWNLSGQSLAAGQTLLVAIDAAVGSAVAPGIYRSDLRLAYRAAGVPHTSWLTGTAPLEITEGDSGGASSAADGGLESNGRLAEALSQRALAQLYGAPAVAALRSARWSALFPAAGPRGSLAVNASPADLPAYTNAVNVVAVDYRDAGGQPVASALIVETEGEIYEHAKALCDRAGGAEVRGLSLVPVRGSALVRTALANRRDRHQDVAVVFKAYETPDGFALHSAWLAGHYPRPTLGQTVLNVQVWASRPGDERWLADALVRALASRGAVQRAPATRLPPLYLRSGSTLGGDTRVELGQRSALPYERAELRARLVMGDGTAVERAVDVATLARLSASFRWPAARGITLELSLDGAVVDRMWLSDGAFTRFDDSLWGGETAVARLDVETCGAAGADEVDRATRETLGPHASRLDLAGCAELEADVHELAGVARHLGGGRAPVDFRAMRTALVKTRSAAPLDLCFESDIERVCAPVPAPGQGGWSAVDLRGLRSADGGPAAAPEATRLITVTASRPGPLDLAVLALALSPTAMPAVGSPAVERRWRDDARPGPNAGCSVHTTGSTPGWGWLLAAFAASCGRWLYPRTGRRRS